MKYLLKVLASILSCPFFNNSLSVVFLCFILIACEYGPKHGRMAQNQHMNFKVLDGDNLEDFTESDLKYQGKTIVVTTHGRCRMGCREIDAYEVQEIIDQDNINDRKSQSLVSSGECPTIAYEGYTRDKQHVRVILGDCKDDPIIITVIDLENEYKCDCT
ncbi:MAG: DUF4258 domain-containing protein [Saprospiraceae bacterium]|nr:DUF4258 domain-containing protein [Saprospiraceae bacterium]